jgi:hypothetical protein
VGRLLLTYVAGLKNHCKRNRTDEDGTWRSDKDTRKVIAANSKAYRDKLKQKKAAAAADGEAPQVSASDSDDAGNDGNQTDLADS